MPIVYGVPWTRQIRSVPFCYRYTVKYDIYKVHTPTDALFIKLDKVLKFTLKSRRLAPTYFGL